jgi:hypothetical protein
MDIFSEERMKLQLLLVITRAVTLQSEPRRNHDHILVFQVRDTQNWRDNSRYFLTNRVAQLYSRHWVHFSTPQSAHRTIVNVVEAASTRATCVHSLSHRKHRLQQPFSCCMIVSYGNNLMAIEPLDSNGFVYTAVP